MTTITEFLRARFAEDNLTPVDVAAKLRIVATFEAVTAAVDAEFRSEWSAQAAQMWVVLVILALVYADHADFDPAWNVEV